MFQNLITPTAPKERNQTIDIIRAFALFGVVVANFTVDNADVTPLEGRTGLLDQLVYWPIRFFIDDKAMATYCFLFGLGFAIILIRTEQRRGRFVWLHLRRMIALFIIGVLALILSWETIPHEYAMLGVSLLLFYKLPLKVLPVLGLLCIIIPFGIRLNTQMAEQSKVTQRPIITVANQQLDRDTGVYENLTGQRIIIQRIDKILNAEGPGRHFYLLPISDSEYFRKDVNDIFVLRRSAVDSNNRLIIHRPNGKVIENRKVNVYIQEALKRQLAQRRMRFLPESQPSYASFVRNNARMFYDRFKHWKWNDQLISLDISLILSYFLFGLYAGRQKMFFEVRRNENLFKAVRLWGLCIGCLCVALCLFREVQNLLLHREWTYYSQVTTSWFSLVWELGVMAMTFGYVASLTLLLEKDIWKSRLSFLAPVGRMGLTNYLLHIIPYVIFFHYGFHLSGKTGPFYRFMLALPTYGLLILFSRFWFRHFTIGPFEWLWRSTTYLKFQPIKIKSSNSPH